MRARQILPAGLTLLMLLATSACGSGLRVEGAGTPVSKPTASPTTTPTAPPKLATIEQVTLADVRRVLLNSKNLDAGARQVLTYCTKVDRCLQRGATVDVMHSGPPQVVVTISTLDDFSFGAFLLAPEPEPAGLRLVWSLKAEKLKIYPSKQGDLVVESGIFRTTDSPCCPSGSRIEVYRWSDGRMKLISASEQP